MGGIWKHTGEEKQYSDEGTYMQVCVCLGGDPVKGGVGMKRMYCDKGSQPSGNHTNLIWLHRCAHMRL